MVNSVLDRAVNSYGYYPEDNFTPVTEDLYKKHVWDVIDSYFEENRGLQSASIASFNRFVKETLPNIVETCGELSVEDRHNDLMKTVHSLKFTKVYIEREVIHISPDKIVFPLYPHEARSRNLTYSTPLSVDVKHTIKLVDAAGYEESEREFVHTKIPIADIPIMVKSEFCRLHGLGEKELASYHEDPDDPGGYFIVNGKEKVIVTQEKPANNKLFLFKPMCDSKFQYECEIRSAVDSTTDKVSALWIHIPGNPKSYQTFKDIQKPKPPPIPVTTSGTSNKNIGRPPAPCPRPKSKLKTLHSESVRKNVAKQYRKTRPGLVVTIATVRGTIPLLILFRALGFESDQEVWQTFMMPTNDLDFYEAMRATMENAEALQIQDQEEALHFIGFHSIKETATREELIDHGARVLSEEVLPSLGPEKECYAIKGYHVGYMVNRLVNAYLGRIPCDDRDHLENKRFDMAGSMLANVFKAQIKSLMRESKLAILRRLDSGTPYDIEKNIIRQKLITRGLVYALSSGNWGDRRRGSTGRVGVAQILNRLTGIATISYLRRINSPVNRLVRMTAPRQVHTTGFGYICPSDTPEGETVGLLKSLSVMAEVTTKADKWPIVECLEECGYQSIEEDPDSLSTDTKILIDSEIMGTCPRKDVSRLLERLKLRRRQYNEVEESEQQMKRLEDPDYVGTYHGFSSQVSIHYDCEHGEIRIRTDAGRAFRPLLVVKNNTLALTKGQLKRLLDPEDPYGWKNLIRDGAVELLDAAESESAMIAMFPSDLSGTTAKAYSGSGQMRYKVTYTHCEIHPSMILGVCASLIPYPDHNQSPRNTYQSGMAKQAIGVYQTNYFYRTDAEAHVLHYPQRPLVTTKTSKFIKYDENPAGVNAIAAICCYSGYNQEDSVIMNKSAVQRGIFRSTLYKTKTDEAKTCRGRGDMDETFELPRKGEVTVFKSPYYVHLDEDGLPAPGIQLSDNDAIIGKTQMITLDKDMRKDKNSEVGQGQHQRAIKTDESLMFRSSAASYLSYVDSVLLTTSQEGYRLVKVKIRTPRIPQIGDKFASRHGQKGVMGMDFDEVDLPFTKEGIVPEVILNPHAIPSRMTIGHLLETVKAKEGALLGEIQDSTCFTRKIRGEEIGVQLEKLGFNKHGLEVMYCGATGRKIMSQIFIGPCFYQRLKHMTEDKLHIRSRGPLTELCKQPSAGLQKEGGLRFGEMERDSTISHGAAAFLRERLFIVSDYHARPVCKKCGNMLSKAPANASKEYILHVKCRFCKDSNAGAVTVEIPYACKLFFQELMSMNIRVMITPEDDYKVKPKNLPKPDDLPGPDGPSILSYLLDKMDKDLELNDGS